MMTHAEACDQCRVYIANGEILDGYDTTGADTLSATHTIHASEGMDLGFVMSHCEICEAAAGYRTLLEVEER